MIEFTSFNRLKKLNNIYLDYCSKRRGRKDDNCFILITQEEIIFLEGNLTIDELFKIDLGYSVDLKEEDFFRLNSEEDLKNLDKWENQCSLIYGSSFYMNKFLKTLDTMSVLDYKEVTGYNDLKNENKLNSLPFNKQEELKNIYKEKKDIFFKQLYSFISSENKSLSNDKRIEYALEKIISYMLVEDNINIEKDILKYFDNDKKKEKVLLLLEDTIINYNNYLDAEKIKRINSEKKFYYLMKALKEYNEDLFYKKYNEFNETYSPNGNYCVEINLLKKILNGKNYEDENEYEDIFKKTLTTKYTINLLLLINKYNIDKYDGYTIKEIFEVIMTSEKIHKYEKNENCRIYFEIDDMENFSLNVEGEKEFSDKVFMNEIIDDAFLLLNNYLKEKNRKINSVINRDLIEKEYNKILRERGLFDKIKKKSNKERLKI